MHNRFFWRLWVPEDWVFEDHDSPGETTICKCIFRFVKRIETRPKVVFMCLRCDYENEESECTCQWGLLGVLVAGLLPQQSGRSFLLVETAPVEVHSALPSSLILIYIAWNLPRITSRTVPNGPCHGHPIRPHSNIEHLSALIGVHPRACIWILGHIATV